MAKRPIYFGKLMAELAMQAEHGHFRNAKNYSEETGVYLDDRTRRLIFTISINGIRFDYDTVKESHTFFRLDGSCWGTTSVKGGMVSLPPNKMPLLVSCTDS